MRRILASRDPWCLFILWTALIVFLGRNAEAATPVEQLAALKAQREVGRLTLDNADRTPLRFLLQSPEVQIRLEAKLLIACLYLEDGNSDYAAQICREIIHEKLPGAPKQRENAIIKLAEIHQRKEENTEALRLLEPIIKDESKSLDSRIEAAYRCALIHRDRGDAAHMKEAQDWAVYTAKKAYSSPEELPFWKALTSLRIVTQRPKSENDLLSKANQQRLAGNYKNALGLYESALGLIEDTALKAGARWGKADCLYHLGNVEESFAQWKTLYEEDPSGPYRGQTLVSLGDLDLERNFDLINASKSYEKCQAVFEGMRERLGEGIDPTWSLIAEKIFLRRGMVSYIEGDQQAALTSFRLSRNFAKPRQPTLSGLEPAPRPIDKVIDFCENRSQLTPKLVLGTKNRVGLMLFLADFSIVSNDPIRAMDLFGRVLSDQEKKTLTPSQVQLEYCYFRRTEALFALKKHDDHYKSLCEAIQRYPRSQWVPDLLLRKGVAEYTRKQDPAAACKTFDLLAETYRGHAMAESAMWYSATVKYWQGDWLKADYEYRRFLSVYPKSDFRKIIETELLPEIQKKAKSTQGTNRE